MFLILGGVWAVGCIDLVICIAYWCGWAPSENTCWWMCLQWSWQGYEGPGVEAGNVGASRLVGWHANRWIAWTLTVSNVCNSIIPSPPYISLVFLYGGKSVSWVRVMFKFAILCEKKNSQLRWWPDNNRVTELRLCFVLKISASKFRLLFC